LLLSRRHAPGYRIVIDYHYPRLSCHEKLRRLLLLPTETIKRNGGSWAFPSLPRTGMAHQATKNPSPRTRRTKLGNTRAIQPEWAGGGRQAGIG
jgi:hypothetical protein